MSSRRALEQCSRLRAISCQVRQLICSVLESQKPAHARCAPDARPGWLVHHATTGLRGSCFRLPTSSPDFSSMLFVASRCLPPVSGAPVRTQVLFACRHRDCVMCSLWRPRSCAMRTCPKTGSVRRRFRPRLLPSYSPWPVFGSLESGRIVLGPHLETALVFD